MLIKKFKDFSLNENNNIDKKQTTNFILDFGYFLSMNLIPITKNGIDKISSDELVLMMSNLRKPLINGMTYSELILDTNDLYSKPKLLSALFSKIRELLIYIEPRIKKLVVDGEYKTNLLKKIDDFRKRYKELINN